MTVVGDRGICARLRRLEQRLRAQNRPPVRAWWQCWLHPGRLVPASLEMSELSVRQASVEEHGCVPRDMGEGRTIVLSWGDDEEDGAEGVDAAVQDG